MPKSIAIVGAGISGLATAFWILKNKNTQIESLTFFEANHVVGGVLQSVGAQQGYVCEGGAQGVLSSRETFCTLLQELGISPQVSSPWARRRFLITPGQRLERISPLKMFKYLKEYFFKRQGRFESEETLFDFFARHFGNAFSEKFLVPLSFGIWGGASEKILVRHVWNHLLLMEEKQGSLIRGFLHKKIRQGVLNFTERRLKTKSAFPRGLLSFPQGMHTLPQALWKRIEALCQEKNIALEIFLNTTVSHIEKKEGGVFVSYAKKNSSEDISAQEFLPQEKLFSAVVCTVQPWRAPHMTFGPQNSAHHVQAQDVLRQTPNHTLIVVSVGGPFVSSAACKGAGGRAGLKTSVQEKHFQGLGALENRASQDLLGVLFVHDIYPSHVPQDHFLFRCMFGGDRPRTGELLLKSSEELVALAREKLAALGLVSEKATVSFTHVARWPQYIPLATGHQDGLLKAIWQLEALEPGLFFAGNYLKGVGVDDCLRQSQKTAQDVAKFLLIEED
jgi:oxygen-dependent protoporphyrinogen oxidase